MIMQKTVGPVVLVVLDGWGAAPESESNPFELSKLPTFKKLYSEGENSRLWAHGGYVGLLKDQDGNSEAGHLNIGAGRVVKQDPVIISESIEDGTFFKNPALIEAIQHVKRNNSNMHLFGMLSDGQSAHSTPEHLYTLLDFVHKEKLDKVFVHLFTDGRDSGPHAGDNLLKDVQKNLKPEQKIATIMGRFYAMDRKKEWSRTEKAYNSLVLGEGKKVANAEQVFELSYKNNITDEYIEPHIIYQDDKPIVTVEDNDSIIFFNHRSDRARQLTKVFVQEDFEKKNPGSFVPKKKIKNLRFVAMTDFGPDLGDVLTAYPSIDIQQTLPVVLSEKRQIYIAESEKYAHMTYFFNGGFADPVGGEERVMIPSPNVRNYSETPGMSTNAITEKIVSSITENSHDFIAANIACTDMIGHTGSFKSAQESLQVADVSLLKIINAVEKKDGVLILTSDHGNIEEMKDPSKQEEDTEHSKNQVPFIVWSKNKKISKLRQEGVLADIAPTIIDLFGLSKPDEMTGKSLFI